MFRLFVATVLLAASTCLAEDLWVSSRGSISNPGSREAPLPSIHAALERDPAAHIFVLPGRYVLERPINLGPANSGVIVEAADPKSPPVLSGGRVIEGFKATSNGLWRAPADVRFEQLWVNGRRADRARTPNEGWLFMKAPAGYITDSQTKSPRDGSRSAFRADDGAMKILERVDGGDVQNVLVVAWHSWSVSQQWISRIDPATGTVYLSGSAMWPFFHFGDNQRYHLENYLGALDAPGEWFQSRDGSLYYKPRPGEDMASTVAVAPVLSQLVVINDAQRVTLKSLRFEHSGYGIPRNGIPGQQAAAEVDAAIMLDGARDVRLQSLEVAHTGQYGIWFRRGCRSSVLEQSLLEDLGAGGVRIGETASVPPEEKATTGIELRNNTIRDGGRGFPGSVGVLIGHSGGNRVIANEISGFFYTGISVGWTWGYARSLATGNLIEGNHVYDIGFGLLSDMAGIYTLGPSPGTIVRGNSIHDILSYDQYGRGGWGIYADEGTSDMLIEGNLVYRTKSGGFHQHYGRANVVKNNIFAFGTDAQLQRSRVEPHLSFTFSRNIVVSRGAPLLHGQWKDENVRLESNLYFDTTGAVPTWGPLTFAQWQATGKDAGSVIADPQFIDSANDDFRLKKSSPALKLGFVPMDPARTAGRQDGPKAAATRRAAMKSMPLEPPPSPLELREDFESQPTGSPPAFARLSVEGKGDSIATSTERARSATDSLKMQDASGLAQVFNPYFFYRPHHVKGTTSVSFAVWLEEGANFWHEWRDAKTPYRAGPSLILQNGTVSVPGRKLGDVPPRQWVRIEISSGVGPQAKGTWGLLVTPESGTPQRYELPFRDAEWRTLEWLGFVSNDTKATAIFIDDIAVVNR